MRKKSGMIWKELQPLLESLSTTGKMMIVGILMYQFGEAGMTMALQHVISQKEMEKVRGDMIRAKEIIEILRKMWLEPMQQNAEWWQKQIEGLRVRLFHHAMMSDDPELILHILKCYDRLQRKAPAIQVNVLTKMQYRSPVTGQVVELEGEQKVLPEGEG